MEKMKLKYGLTEDDSEASTTVGDQETIFTGPADQVPSSPETESRAAPLVGSTEEVCKQTADDDTEGASCEIGKVTNVNEGDADDTVDDKSPESTQQPNSTIDDEIKDTDEEHEQGKSDDTSGNIEMDKDVKKPDTYGLMVQYDKRTGNIRITKGSYSHVVEPGIQSIDTACVVNGYGRHGNAAVHINQDFLVAAFPTGTFDTLVPAPKEKKRSQQKTAKMQRRQENQSGRRKKKWTY